MNKAERNSSYLNEFAKLQSILGIIAISTLSKLIIEIPIYRPINRLRIAKNGVVISERSRIKHDPIEVPDDYEAFININGMNWYFRDRKSKTNNNIKGIIFIAGKMARNGERIHMKRRNEIEITQDNPQVEKDGVKVRFE